MRMMNLAAVAALAILAASPAFAGDRHGGGHPGGGHPGGGSGCGGGCGGGHQPPPYTPPPHTPPPGHGGGGYTGNINVNVNASANANAWAGAAGGSYFNARTYDVGGMRGGGGSYGAVYVGGGYGGDGGGYYGGGAIYTEEVYEGRTCASAPFGYVVNGFGRNGRRAPACVANTGGCEVDVDRGGRYGYSERHSCPGTRREDHDAYADSGSYEARSYEAHGSYERRETYREETAYSGGYIYVDDRGAQGGHDCDCDHGGHGPAPYPPVYSPEPPRYEPPRHEPSAPPARPYQPERPRQHYSQEPGERG